MVRMCSISNVSILSVGNLILKVGICSYLAWSSALKKSCKVHAGNLLAASLFLRQSTLCG